MTSFRWIIKAGFFVFASSASGCSGDPVPSPDTGASASSESEGSTGLPMEGATGETTGTISASASDGSDGDSTGSTGGAHPVECSSGTCIKVCTQLWDFEDPQGATCSCEKKAVVDGYLECELPVPCEADDYLCIVQAIRWGVVGSYSWGYFIEDQGGETATIQVLAPGLVRGTVSSLVESACCQGTISKDQNIFVLPGHVDPPDAPSWQGCLASLHDYDEGHDALPPCVHPGELTGAQCVGGLLTECPLAPRPGATCEEACPMAGDGVCDESIGTGLCPDGCDPLDCTCDDDLPFQCDDVLSGGRCPIGSDPDC
jgi:hypothetical protein